MAISTDLSNYSYPCEQEPCEELPPLSIAPARPPRRIQWRVLHRLLRELMADPEATDKVFKIFDAVGGDGGERTFQRFLSQPDGERLLRERPSLVELLADRESLAAMPADSLGAAYYAFAERNGFPADGLVEANRDANRETDADLDPDRQWFFDRYTAMHDLWHVLTGNGTDVDGESLLLAFSYAQTPQRGFGVLVSWIALQAGFQPGFQRALWRAYRAGKRAAPLVGLRWEERMPQSLAGLRRELGIEVAL